MQGYARDRVPSVTWTDREVKAFTQVGVEPGEWVEVMILVLAGDCTVVAARDAASSDRASSISCSAAAHASRTSAPPPSPSTTCAERALRHPLDGPGNAVMPGACDRFTVSARAGRFTVSSRDPAPRQNCVPPKAPVAGHRRRREQTRGPLPAGQARGDGRRATSNACRLSCRGVLRGHVAGTHRLPGLDGDDPAGAVQGPPHGCEAALARGLTGRRPGFGTGGAVGVFRRRGSRPPAW
ncbi:hypothetical protein AB0958_33860 [Streptomyces sp. NPDC006655]|uniref:hypothetical protein n=1 Tax=Streptomyces sp. NPDC006655 TaxID=3156898 RepID=UPI003451A8EE